MKEETFCYLLLSAFLVCSTPGPNMLHVLTRSVQLGLKKSLASMAGCVSGLTVLLLLSALGLGIFIHQFPAAFFLLKYLGIAYLFYLGVHSWNSTEIAVDLHGGCVTLEHGWVRYLKGFSVGVSNPKLLLFGVSFMPQFIDATRSQIPQLSIILLCFIFSELCWYGVYGACGRYIARHLSSQKVCVVFNKIVGLLFIGFGAAVCWV